MSQSFKDTKIKEAAIILAGVSIILLIIQTIYAYNLKTEIKTIQFEYDSLDKTWDFLRQIDRRTPGGINWWAE